MKNLLKGMLIGFIIGGILLAAAAFLFFRHPTEEPEPEVPAAEVSKAVQEEAPESGISLPEEPETPEIPAVEPTREASEEVSEPEEPDSALLAFAGDVMFSDPFLASYDKSGISAIADSEMLGRMQNADLFVINEEFPFSLRGEAMEDKQFTFRADPKYVEIFQKMGVDIATVANNHALDFGRDAFLDTLDTLNGIGMPYVGAGRNLEEAIQPVYFIVNDQKIAFVAATQIERTENPDTKEATQNSPGVFRCWNVDKLLEVVANAKQVSDYVIVYIHWGTEATDQLDWAQKDQAVKISNAGADLIIGDHPHVLQQFGYCEDTPVMYSLGNFLFNSKAQDTCLVKLTLDANGFKSLQFIPGRQQDCSVTMLHGTEKERVLSYMRKISPGVTIDEDGFVTKKG